MARYTGPSCKLCRREGKKLFLKGDRCVSGKCALDRRPTAPGQHGAAAKKIREYGMQLRAKQTAKRYYGVLEKQFKNYYEEADRKEGITGENLIVLLERRFDNVVYRMGFAASHKEARQLLLHRHFLLNGKHTNIPSVHLSRRTGFSYPSRSGWMLMPLTSPQKWSLCPQERTLTLTSTNSSSSNFILSNTVVEIPA